MPLELTPDELSKLWAHAEPVRKDQTLRQNYYAGKHAILSRHETYAGDVAKVNRVANWPKYIVNRFVGMLTSESYMVTSKEGDAENEGPERYSEISEFNDFVALDVELLRLQLAQGSAIELHEFSDNAITVTGHDPRKWLLLRDTSGALVGAIYIVRVAQGTIQDDKPLAKPEERMFFYNDTTRTEFKRTVSEGTSGVDAGSKWETVEDIPHEYGRVPVFEWRANASGDSLISDDLIGLVDEYNEIFSAAGDDIRREVDALLAIKGFDAEYLRENADIINETRILPLGSEESSKAEFLTRKADVEPDTRHLARTREIIHMTGEVPDVEEITGATGQTSGIALRLKFLPMLQSASSIANNIKKGLRARIDLLNVRLDQSEGGVIEDVNLIITFTLPANRIEEWKAINNLNDQVSHKKRLELLTDVDDPEQELERIAEEGAGIDETLSAEEVQIQQDAEVARLAALTGPAIQLAVDAVAAAALDAVLKSGAIERTAKRAEEENGA